MVEVYYSKNIEGILENIDFSNLGENVAIKTHFGEKGCDTYINPEIVRRVYEKVQSLGKKATLIECNVLYKGERTKASSHKKLAKKHGFDFAEIDILDGEGGDEYVEKDVEKGVVNKAKVGRGIGKYDSMVVLSHFKGHIAAGYGGVFKNVGMGLGSRAGKLHMHSNISPSINRNNCIACGKCIENCDFDAIHWKKDKNGEKKAEIDSNKCVGCAMCIAVCPQKAVKIPWEGCSNDELQKRIVDYFDSIVKDIGKDNMIYINVLENITKNCDCDGEKQEPIMEDIGILVSYDPVAIDKASLDLANKNSNNEFDNINDVNKNVQVDYAFEKGLGNKNYEIKNIK